VVFNPTGPPPAEKDTKVIVTKNINIFTLLPEAVQEGIEKTLIAILFLNLLFIVGLGIGFSFQALLATSFDLPEGVVELAKNVKVLVDKNEQYFTPSIVTFFLVSTLLGSYKVAQLSSGESVYMEEVPANSKASSPGPIPPAASGSSSGSGSTPPPSSPSSDGPAKFPKRDLKKSGPLI